MLKRFRNNSGQAIGAEMVVTLVLVIAAITLLSTYVRRTMQGRARDATIYARDEASSALGGDVILQYEPYYIESEARTSQDSTDTHRFDAVGEFMRSFSQRRNVNSISSQLAPRERD